MSAAELVILSVALGTDLFSVAVPIGMNRLRRRIIIQSAVIFALFHIIMILAGYHAGHWLGHMVEHVSAYHVNWPAAAIQNGASILGAMVLTCLGIRMIKNNLTCEPESAHPGQLLQGVSLVMLAAGVSVDALAAGFSLGMMDVDLVMLSVILGVVIFLIAIAGLVLGRKVGRCVGTRAELIGGTILLLLGIHLLWSIIL